MNTAHRARGARRPLTAAILLAGVVAATVSAPSTVHAQWSTSYEQFYLPGDFNWSFRKTYPAADRLFNAFDYGHAILYERLYNRPHAPTSELEEKEYDFITKKLLVSPPRLPLEEAAIEVNYAKIAPEAKMMFDWAHLLHRQIYDVLAVENMSWAQKDAEIARIVGYYKTRKDLAFSSRPKNMELMEEQPYSLAFRKSYPKFNGLIWGYHWLQVGLYEPMMIGKTQAERQAGVAAAVTRFRQMLIGAPEHMPRIMPMTIAIAPTFSKRYQEAAIIFDNLHAMHDVISDILANDKVPRSGKRAAILEAGSRYRDNTTFLMPLEEWATMGEMMGVANMGGPAVGILPGFPTPTIARGATMEEAMKAMPGMAHGEAGTTGSHPVNPSGATAKDSATSGQAAAAGGHGAHGTPAAPVAVRDTAMTRLYERMLRDPVIRQRLMADSAARRMLSDMGIALPAPQAMPAKVAAPARPRPRAAARPAGSSVPTTQPPAAAPQKTTPPPPAEKKDMKGMPGMKH